MMQSLLKTRSSSLISMATSSSLLTTKRHETHHLLGALSKLSSSRDVAEDIKAGRSRQNRAIIAAMEQTQTMEEIHYRNHPRPWELVPRFAKKRVTDLVGILSSEDRMEIEQTIEKMLPICDVDLYVVIVPTVGYMNATPFSNSIFFDWQIGEPKGNGLLLFISQREAEVHLVAGNAIEDYFGKRFLDPLMEDVFQPMLAEGKPSQAIVQVVYAIARHAQEARSYWQGGLVPMPVRNKATFAAKLTIYGFRRLPWYSFGAIAFACLTFFFYDQLMDAKCPQCGTFMHRARSEAAMRAVMTNGQWLEFYNECAHYRVWRCPKCPADDPAAFKVQMVSRDLHQHDKCLKCMDCDYYTCNLTKTIEKLPSRTEDGVKRLFYECENCRIGRDVAFPLYRPLDQNPDSEWYDFLVDRSQAYKEKPKEKERPNIAVAMLGKEYFQPLQPKKSVVTEKGE